MRAADWAIQIALGAFGGVLGAFGAMVAHYVAARDWNAAVAIATVLGVVATLAAVLVALLPFWRDEQRRKASATALRMGAMVYLTHLRGYLRRCHKAAGPVPAGSKFLEHETARASLDSLSELLTRAHVLDADDQQFLAAAINACEGVRIGIAAPDKDYPFVIEQLLGMVSGAYDQLARGIDLTPARQAAAAERVTTGLGGESETRTPANST